MCIFQKRKKKARLQNLRWGSTTVGRWSRCHQEFTSPQEHFGIAIVFRVDKSVCEIRPGFINLKFPTTSSVAQKICIKMGWCSFFSLRKTKIRNRKYHKKQPLRYEKKTSLKTDASHGGLGATLEQLQGAQWKTIAFASMFLNNHEKKYSTNELEILGAVWASEHFRNYLYGAEFEIITDHKALLSALSANHGNKTAQPIGPLGKQIITF